MEETIKEFNIMLSIDGKDLENELKLYYESDDSAFCFVDIKAVSK